MTLAEARAQLDAALARGEPSEALYPRMHEIAHILDHMGYPSHANDVRASARTLIPMFGMRAETERRALPWWRRLGRRRR
jgi:hypothetical protein